MRRKMIALLLVLALMTALFAGCAKKAEETQAPVATAAPVTLTVAGGWADFRALDDVAKLFTAKYPNCTIVYEYLQDYYSSLVKRMSGDNPVDLFVTTNVQAGSEVLPYALELYGCEGVDLSNTFSGLIQNFELRESATDKAKLYAVPLGADIRGMYVNMTLLNSLGISKPTNQKTLLEACEALKQKGYIPFHGNPGSFSQLLLYPWICNQIANAKDAKATYEMVNNKEAGTLELLKAPLELLYTMVEKGYYDYKTAQTENNLFTETTDIAYARDFLNIVQDGETYVKKDDMGLVAFMPSAMSLSTTIARAKEDYHSEIEFSFIPAPVGEDGGFAYLSPAHGIAISNKSGNLEWAEKFLDFLFQPENNKVFAKSFNIIPNTKEAFDYITQLFDIPSNRISHLGQVTFGYGFYEELRTAMVDLSKANNPKYMLDDGNGNLSLYPIEHYMEPLVTFFSGTR